MLDEELIFSFLTTPCGFGDPPGIDPGPWPWKVQNPNQCICQGIPVHFILFFNLASPHRGGFPGDSESRESACNAGDPGSIPGVRKIPCRREWQPIPIFLPGKSHQKRSSPWGRKESASMHTPCGILVPRQWIELLAPPLQVWSLNHWPTREFPRDVF